MSTQAQVPGPLTMPVLQPIQLLPQASLSGARMASMNASAAQLSSASRPMAPSAPSPHALSRNNPLMQTNFEKASSVCSSIDDMLAALGELYEINAFWKNKYINCKKEHFQKFMGSNSETLRGSAFQEWKAYTFETGSSRKLEGKQEDIDKLTEDATTLMQRREEQLQKKLEEMERRHQKQLGEMASIIDKQTKEISWIQSEKTDIQSRFDTSRGILKLVKGHVCTVSDSNYKVVTGEDDDNARPYLGNFDYTKQSMHDILNEIDPKYVPPVGSLCVGPPPAPVGTPLLRGVVSGRQ